LQRGVLQTTKLLAERSIDAPTAGRLCARMYSALAEEM
jgi:hypothetical protein